MRLHAMISVFWMLSFKPTSSLSSFTFIKKLFSSSLSAIRVVWSASLRLLIFLPAILIPACASSSPTFLMMYSAYKLTKQGDNMQPWRTPFLIWNQSVVPCPVLTFDYWLQIDFSRGPITSWQIDGEKVETVRDIFSWASKLLWSVTALTNLKHACSLEVKLCWERLRTRGEGGDRMRWLVGIIFNGHEFERTPRDSEAQGSLACCNPWGSRVRHNWVTEKQQQNRKNHTHTHTHPPTHRLYVFLPWSSFLFYVYCLYNVYSFTFLKLISHFPDSHYTTKYVS